MKQRFLILIGIVVLIIVLIGLNAASFVQKEKVPDSEFKPNRSSFNTGATGTRAFYDLLAETGRKPMRWQESPSALLNAGKNTPSVFVIIGETRLDYEENEIKQLLRWVSQGGKLVIIDRFPNPELLQTTADWKISADLDLKQVTFGIDPSNQTQMTDKTSAAKPIQPTSYTTNVNAVQPSRFASAISFERLSESDAKKKNIDAISVDDEPKFEKTPAPIKKSTPTPKPLSANKNGLYTMPTPEPLKMIKKEIDGTSVQNGAPVEHLSNDEKTLLADFPYGAGKIVFLSDPYIVSNGGIELVDNAQLAINIVATGNGIIAFDEYHQGYGSENNQLFAYFAGTPVVPIFLQCLALIAVVLFSQSRRFARSVPEPELNRLSKLEYVSAMAELQQRIKGFDLAIENIYNDFRRRVSRLVGVDNFTATNAQIAQLIAERLTTENAAEIESVMEKSKAITQGEPTNKKEVLKLTRRLRELEEKLGLQRRKRSRK